MDNEESNQIITPMPLPEKCKVLLDTWMQEEKGTGEYKLVGGYWELLYPLFQKYAPEELQKYERATGEKFEHFNSEVREVLDAGDEETNFRNAVNYMIDWMRTHPPGSVHHIDMPDDEILAYIPNQNIDQNDYWGREDNSDLF